MTNTGARVVLSRYSLMLPLPVSAKLLMPVTFALDQVNVAPVDELDGLYRNCALSQALAVPGEVKSGWPITWKACVAAAMPQLLATL
jgi:hypothetical protein